MRERKTKRKKKELDEDYMEKERKDYAQVVRERDKID